VDVAVDVAESVPASAADDQAAAPDDEEPSASAPAEVAAAEAQPEPATAAPSATPVPTESATATPRPTITPVPVGATSRATATPDFPDEVNGLPTIAFEDLPRQAQETIDLIDEGGPFPFDRDGITFQNREGILPDEFRGYYSEYTVITPGESDRGARRIVAGQDGELYYTDDHYDSFSYVVR
ncbi:MAG: ribonuclease domain-containing protein, partial [Caldilineaceae bacterium]